MSEHAEAPLVRARRFYDGATERSLSHPDRVQMTAAVGEIIKHLEAASPSASPSADPPENPESRENLDRVKFHYCLGCGWRGRRYDLSPHARVRVCPECTEPVWEETVGITRAADDAGDDTSASACQRCGKPGDFRMGDFHHIWAQDEWDCVASDGPSAEGRIARMAREAGIEAPIRPDSENEVSSPRSDDDVGTAVSHTTVIAAVRALAKVEVDKCPVRWEGGVDHDHHVCNTDHDRFKYHACGICGATLHGVWVEPSTPSAETTALHLLKRRPSSTAPVEYREAWEGQVRRFLASDADGDAT